MPSIAFLLDALNFLSADAHSLFGPFVNVYLVTDRHWSQTSASENMERNIDRRTSSICSSFENLS